ncbi:2-dehydro-3-deoxygalactonokinase [Shigella flexneri]
MANNGNSCWRQYWIIPGLCVSHDDNHNVMRGEETQFDRRASYNCPLFMLCRSRLQMGEPNSQQINDFRTVMTGELHDLLNH